jgi:hypothetical protein
LARFSLAPEHRQHRSACRRIREESPVSHHSSPVSLLLLATVVAGLNAAAAPAPAPAQVRPTPERAAHMQVHFSQVMTVHEAVIRGDLAAVQAPAAWLTQHEGPSSLPPGSAPFVAEMRRAAARTAKATTVLEAAMGAADMLKTCGDCHRGVGTMPAVATPSGPEVGGIVGHMLAHQRATDQMVQGLVVPSSDAWRKGAAGLAVAPLRRSSLPDDPKLTSELVASEKRIHELADQAGKAGDPGARAVSYGQIIARCADCHALHRKVWGPGRR